MLKQGQIPIEEYKILLRQNNNHNNMFCYIAKFDRIYIKKCVMLRDLMSPNPKKYYSFHTINFSTYFYISERLGM